MRAIALAIIGTITAGCSPAATNRILYGDPQVKAERSAFNGHVSNVLVTEGDFGQAYRILGPVNWPEDAVAVKRWGPSLWGYGGYICEPQKVAAAAVHRYGPQVSAVIGVIKSQPSGKQEHCDGTAVAFEK